MQYVAFLLGINLGRRSVKMADLKALMEKEGLTEVRTVLASGNVIFNAKKVSPAALVRKLEAAYEKKFGFKIGVIIRTMKEIEAMIAAQPFKKVKVTKNTRRYVTLLAEEPEEPEKVRMITKHYQILKVSPLAVYSVLELSPNLATPDVMKLLGRSYGKPARPGKITTRNWNTIEKIAALA